MSWTDKDVLSNYRTTYGPMVTAALCAVSIVAVIFKQEALVRALSLLIFGNLAFVTGMSLEHDRHTERKAAEKKQEFYQDHEEF